MGSGAVAPSLLRLGLSGGSKAEKAQVPQPGNQDTGASAVRHGEVRHVHMPARAAFLSGSRRGSCGRKRRFIFLQSECDL